MLLLLKYKSNKNLDTHIDINETVNLDNPDDPKMVILIHKQKREVLKVLIEQELNIKEIENITKINPGTIKRHLDDLVENGLVLQTQTIKNEYGFVLKYYRAVVKKLIVNFEWP